MKSFFFGCALLVFTACSDENDARRALTDMGFTSVRITDTDIFTAQFDGCGKHEAAYKASATNPIGKQVQLVVCCGSTNFKGCTVRSK